MITSKEIDAVKLSATKRDFYQIWNELLDTAGKLSERWDPSSTNESDPGIVLLKVLTAVADKLNYTIDKNTLEAFMPSASQEESMRKLCDMLGYNIKYYQSATTNINISYIGTDYDLGERYTIIVPKFTNVKNADEDINYVILKDVQLQGSITSWDVEAAEGEYVQYDNITLDLLDDNQRYYLPETQIAENGIFLIDATDNTIVYEKVNNLNTQLVESYCYKFGFDSKKMTPYIQFPADISSIIGNGIKFGFLRTNGINGNVSARTLNVLDTSNIIMNDAETGETVEIDEAWFTVKNTSAATNGTNKETLNSAYTNFKHTIGTFDTLVTCRDYMNKIYQLTFGDVANKVDPTPLVSNVIVSDIRDDLNREITICSFNEQGITYLNKAKTTTVEGIKKNRIDCFDLIVYPFGTIHGTNTKDEYKNSFVYTDENFLEIKSGLNKQKTIAHTILRGNESKKDSEFDETTNLACIKNYENLKAKITTTKKVNSVEESSILKNIYTAIYSTFNMRQMEFGEEIPFDSILETIKNADTRIKNITLETDYETKFALVDGSECSLNDQAPEKAQRIQNDLAVRNVLAGRIPLFNYDTNFTPALNESGATVYPASSENYITKLVSSYEPGISTISKTNPLELNESELIQFRAPNFISTVTYPSYVNYYVILNKQIGSIDPTPATLISLKDKLGSDSGLLYTFANYSSNETSLRHLEVTNYGQEATYYNTYYNWLFYKSTEGEQKGTYVYDPNPEVTEKGKKYYYIPFESQDLALINTFVKEVLTYTVGEETKNRLGLFKKLAADLSRVKGKYIDTNLNKYTLAEVIDKTTISGVSPQVVAFRNLYVQDTHNEIKLGEYTADGLGLDGELKGIIAGEEYELQNSEFLLINYTDASKDDNGNTTNTVVNKCYAAGTIIKPNFALNDSATVHTQQGKSYAKKTGFDFSGTSYSGNPEGMFANDANQQIEIREQVIVNLGLDEDATNDSVNVFVYWLRNDDSLKATDASHGTIEFKWDEQFVGEGETGYYSAYTLKDGEYFFYTDKNKTDLAYYGSGSTIKRTNKNITIAKNIAEDSITSESIMQYGLAAAIPWISKLLGKDTSTDPIGTIKIYEYQYINLTTKDKLLEITAATSESGDKLTALWKKITAATYRFNGTEAEVELPTIKLSSTGDNGWEARSLLQYNVGPNLTQTLHKDDKIEIYYYESSTSIPIVVPEGQASISIKTNELKQQMEPQLDVSKKYAEGEWVDNKDFKIKTFTYNEVKFNDVSLDLGNLGNGLTQCSLTTLNDNGISLYLSIPGTDYGLIMFYVKNINDKGNIITEKNPLAGHPYIIPTNVNISIFNNTKIEEEEIKKLWWDGFIDVGTGGVPNKYYLHYGLNIVQIDLPDSASPDMKLTVYAGDNKAEDTLIFSNLDLVNEETQINPDINFITGDTLTGILDLIKALDPDYEFYYNNILDNSNLININSSSGEKLSDSKIWYDYNNINNKFVITEINADKLASGIVIENTSKL